MAIATIITLIVTVTIIFALLMIGVVVHMQDWDWGSDYMRVIAPFNLVLLIFSIGLAFHYEINDRRDQINDYIDTHVNNNDDESRDTITIDGQVYVPLDESKED